ncbi:MULTISPECIES: winged helix-turn-helix domain-containing protein [Streptomyces]|uniref:Winged helix-turn-helix transcriptional regulator n=1 Tax=Streptomyces rhizosphaericus TaxID=114699 RepID=A0A6G4AQP3_9ACTN|nr:MULTISPECIES: winged helix-turn-helix domain-containing protein [Streptomyces]MBA6435299.1 winged helix-turn-helix transcriptional regulator [Streptomyces sp. GMR22]MBI0378509.1 winged helix-turn-helix transcriptional regulator [Streptomyces albiflaviniger]NEW74787.1 winged helix-turn-helix transcriptional regulator [Streptomyces rhizosphaericus]
MTNLRGLSSASASAPAAPTSPSVPPGRQRLRAVAPDEVPPVADLLHPGATWLPAPPHTVPALPGHPPMVGYLVLVPADRQGPETAGPPPEGVPAVTGDELIRIDPDQRTAEIAGRPLDLTYLEFELLSHLVAHPHRVHTRDQLVTTVWGYGHVGDGRTVDVHVARLRRKMGPEHRGTIVTVRRVGYKYVPTV